MKQSTFLLVLLFAALAVCVYHMGRRDERYAALNLQVINLDSRLATVEKSLEKHDKRWSVFNRIADCARKLLPWS